MLTILATKCKRNVHKMLKILESARECRNNGQVNGYQRNGISGKWIRGIDPESFNI